MGLFDLFKSKKEPADSSANTLTQKNGASVDPKDLEKMLKAETNGKTSLEEMISAFEALNDHPLDGIDVEEDSVLFETGAYDFTGEKLFYFSLVRQFPDEEEEYIQLHMDILYPPSVLKHKLSQTTWSDELDSSIFEYVRSSKEYAALKDLPLGKVNIYMEQT